MDNACLCRYYVDGICVMLECSLSGTFAYLNLSRGDYCLEVYRALKAVVSKADMRVAKVDLKDFYVSGTPAEVSTLVSTVIDRTFRDVFTDALLFLLENQFVMTETLYSTYQCIAGSGMGLLHAANVSNVL